jgi:hypothetical protein
VARAVEVAVIPAEISTLVTRALERRFYRSRSSVAAYWLFRRAVDAWKAFDRGIVEPRFALDAVRDFEQFATAAGHPRARVLGARRGR